jgi:predicted protein tyrosine phosphatase
LFELQVVGLAEANQLISENWPTRIVSLMSDPVQDHGPHHLYIQVSDVPVPIEGLIYPLPEHLRLVLAFTRDLADEDRLLVHCFAGQSRSTAIAIGILIDHGMTYGDAFDHVAAVRSVLLPNELFIRHIDTHFGLHNRLVDRVHAHRKEAIGRTIVPKAAEDAPISKLLRLFKIGVPDGI